MGDDCEWLPALGDVQRQAAGGIAPVGPIEVFLALRVLRDTRARGPARDFSGDAAPRELRRRFPARAAGGAFHNLLLQALAAIPVAPTVAAHSIIAVQGEGPVETGDDGVVSYQSAHIPEAVSELVVRAGHSMQAEPETVREVRRILLLHLADVCPQSCVPEHARYGQPLALRAVDAAPPPSPRGSRSQGR
jgi:hypothetical protein